MTDGQIIFWLMAFGVALAMLLIIGAAYMFYVLSRDWDVLDVPMEHYSPWETTPGEVARKRLLEDSKYD